MNYIGSKLSLLNFLETSISKVVDGKCKTFYDLFAGTGIVGTHFKKKGYTVVANDIQFYSYVLNRHYIGNHLPLSFAKLLSSDPAVASIGVFSYLSALQGKPGFIFDNYCLGGTSSGPIKRQYFSDENGQLCDAIRQQIESWYVLKLISDDEYFYLIASLIESVDKYANTASVYGAFLKHLKRSAQKKFSLKPAKLIIDDLNHQVFNQDVNQLLGQVSGDIFYFDPPYNHRQYATNYHLLETIAKYDNPDIHGKTGLRQYQSQKSDFCSKSKVKKAFSDLINSSRARYIFLSYNNEGLLSLSDIKEIMEKRGEYGFFTQEYNRFKADKSTSRQYSANKTCEYLHYVIVK